MNIEPFFFNDEVLQGRLLCDTSAEDFILGKGSYGVVYKITFDGLSAAIKKITLNKDRKSELESVQYVADIWKKLKHPNILKLYEMHFDSYYAYIFNEYAEKRNLKSALSNYSVLPVSLFFKWTTEICACLGYLHNLDPPVIHRDLKPDNILIGSENNILLSDFDFLRKVNPTSRSSMSSGGNLAYGAPEISMNKDFNRLLAPSADIYSLGFIFYEILTCDCPVDADPLGQVRFFQELLNGNRPKRPSACPSLVWKVISSCWRKIPEERPVSAILIQERLGSNRYEVRKCIDE